MQKCSSCSSFIPGSRKSAAKHQEKFLQIGMLTSAKYECHVCEGKSQNITAHLSK